MVNGHIESFNVIMIMIIFINHQSNSGDQVEVCQSKMENAGEGVFAVTPIQYWRVIVTPIEY